MYNHFSKWLTNIYEEHEHGYELDVGIGFILHNPISEEYNYYHVSDNEILFDKAYTIDSKKDVDNFIKKVCCCWFTHKLLSF